LKYLCIHGHFSLPPREDPFTGQMMRDADAAPFRNRYEQVTADCYLPNAVLGNFNLMSFDFAPRLLSYLETHDTTAYSRVISADRGNAFATTFHPVSLPQLSRREKMTQVRWGLKAFEAHFGRQAAGLWLPDLAVDDETLDVLAECGVEFTVLSSEQIRVARARGAGPYRTRLKGRRGLTVFARDHALSDKVAFELNWLGGAGMFAARYLSSRPDDGLLLIATNGETYGHHHPGEEMFVRYLLQQEASNAGYQVVPLAGFLRDHPPEIVAELPGPSSWRADGEDNSEDRPSASWEAPLRAALAHLADAADAIYEREVRAAGFDPWALRDGYAEVLTNRVMGLLYLAEHADRALTHADEERVLALLRAQTHRMAMFDGYAFSAGEFNSVEMRLTVAHAARAASLIAQATGEDLSVDLRRALALATGPRGERTATEIYTEIVEAQHT
jgi:hypothetical protein